MDVAVSGDRASCLTQRLGRSTYLFAIAQGFGTIAGLSPARLALARFKHECERKARRDTSGLIAALGHVNGDLYLRSAAHEDYITGGASLTAILVVAGHAYLAHVGSTAAYLSRNGTIVALTKEDAFELILTRSLGTQSNLEVTVCSFPLSDGDTLVLASRALSDLNEFERAADQSVAIVRYSAGPEPPFEPAPRRGRASAYRIAIATLVFFGLMSL